MKNLKLVAANRFTSRPCGVLDVLTKGAVIEVSDAQAAYLMTLTSKDASNNVHTLFRETDESVTDAISKTLTQQQQLAAAVRAETEEAAEEEEVAEAKAKVAAPKAKAKPATRRARAAKAQ